MNIKIKKGRQTITTDIAYIAGFFDGEGCIRIKKANQKGYSYYLWVAITNTNEGILEWIKSKFGGQIRLVEKSRNKPVYHFNITSSEACDMLKVLIGFLQEKYTQAKLGIEFHENKEKLNAGEKLDYYQKMSLLKKKCPF